MTRVEKIKIEEEKKNLDRIKGTGFNPFKQIEKLSQWAPEIAQRCLVSAGPCFCGWHKEIK